MWARANETPPCCGNVTAEEVLFLEEKNTFWETPRAFARRMRQGAAELHRTAALAGSALFSALGLLLNQFTLAVSQYLEIGFSFLALAVCAFSFGPWLGGLAGIVTDVLGYLLRPNGGFFPGFTLNEFLAGFLYGCWLYKRPVRLARTFFACLSVVVLVNLVLTPLWLHMMYGQTLFLSSLRLIKNALKLPLDTALLYVVLRLAERRGLAGKTR